MNTWRMTIHSLPAGLSPARGCSRARRRSSPSRGSGGRTRHGRARSDGRASRSAPAGPSCPPRSTSFVPSPLVVSTSSFLPTGTICSPRIGNRLARARISHRPSRLCHDAGSDPAARQRRCWLEKRWQRKRLNRNGKSWQSSWGWPASYRRIHANPKRQRGNLRNGGNLLVSRANDLNRSEQRKRREDVRTHASLPLFPSVKFNLNSDAARPRCYIRGPIESLLRAGTKPVVRPRMTNNVGVAGASSSANPGPLFRRFLLTQTPATQHCNPPACVGGKSA